MMKMMRFYATVGCGILLAWTKGPHATVLSGGLLWEFCVAADLRRCRVAPIVRAVVNIINTRCVTCLFR